MAKEYKEMNAAEQAIMDALQVQEYHKINDRNYAPCDSITVLRQLAYQLGLIDSADGV